MSSMNCFLAFLLFGFFSYSYSSNGLRIASIGYRLIGVGCGLMGAMFLLLGAWQHAVALVPGVIGFLVAQLGFGILMTKEKLKDEIVRRHTNLLQRLAGRIPLQLAAQVQVKEQAAVGTPVGRWQTALVAAVCTSSGVLLSLFSDRYVYAALLVVSGLIFAGLALYERDRSSPG
jgi:hypothetical protein